MENFPADSTSDQPFQSCKMTNLGFQVNEKCNFVPVILAVATASVPTYEFAQEKEKFNSIASRKESFWYKMIRKLIDHNVFSMSESAHISQSLESPGLSIYLGWVLVVVWIATLWAVIAIILIYLARLPKAPVVAPPNEATLVVVKKKKSSAK